MKKIAHKTLLSLIALSAFESALALDSGAQTLTNTVGATDYFKVTCEGGTDHFNFQLFENAVAGNPVTETKPTEEPQALSQFLNAKLTKDKLKANISKLIAGTAKEISLKGGNGSYVLKLDTLGTDSSLKNVQTYSVQYQCLNATGKVTSSSSNVKGSLNNGKTKSYTIKCNKSKTTGNTSSLKIKLTNSTVITKTTTMAQLVETPASGDLMAQVLKRTNALNTIGDVLNMQGGDGNYFVMVNSPINEAKNYRFQYSCLNASGVETKTSPVQILQDQ